MDPAVQKQSSLDEEEEEMLKKGMLDWNAMKKKEFWFDRKMIKWYIIVILLIVLVALMTFFHTDIIHWLTPAANRFRALKGGWAIPIAIIFVLSFPPLFGNEIVLILVGVVWGLGEGFGIAAAGTILGEIANFIVFKYWCRGRAEKHAKKSLNYACLARVLRDGGLFLCWLSRLSAIPTHFTTIVYSVCGFSFWKFCMALVLSLPKQLVNVYVGVVLAGESSTTKSSHLVSDIVWAVTAVVSIGAGWYIWWKMSKVRIEVWREMREELALKGVADNKLPPQVDEEGHVVATGNEYAQYSQAGQYTEQDAVHHR
ncbi:hypothetical protein QFC20_007795 [Naganishia adeliensis]|uniref:Uncharacterized protein n=1 Tax=Naganishia adeliensis TaxID=92952 RepID=A0ACC2UVF3_9TREE|nr:hypothetical protein QFC20_007795 [Naganishia adeliensis]